ncbi:T9SS type A sorting domain-containing protein [Flavobacterium silvaticum]|uniref:Secretion system C-terminal sorting domain-containing protein n=1 Tax=Flavobacterium silvaticum TaxID=1852020 RepID=A0A972FS76_9FLAO|nr:T9SS type A sorting domain-containing protein [Flavobacterium silvaticum]NMH27533.1 hypothetical protein [Flavobacterium silvaticum]
MKRFLLLTIICSFSLCSSQNTDYYNRMQYIFGNISTSKVTTGYLKEFGVRYTEIEAYNGALSTVNWVDKAQWNSIYSSLYTMRVGNVAAGMASASSVYTNLNTQQAATSDILIAAQYYQYQQYKTNAVANGDVTISNDQIFDVGKRVPYDTKTVFAAFPLKSSLRGNTFSFKVPNALIYLKPGAVLNQIQVDFGNGQGYQTLALNTAKSVTYSSGGEKEIKIKFGFSGGVTVYSHSKVRVDYIPATPPSMARYNGEGLLYNNFAVTGDAWNGSSATGLVTVELAPGHSQITKPLIVVEGFDPDNSYNYTDFITNQGEEDVVSSGTIDVKIDLATGLTLNQAIENAGYDLVFVNFANGTDYIQRNAYMVKAVINWVNGLKTGNEKNVVMGMSMGGLVARYALRDMEIHNQIHETKLYISHDAPHQGANVPLAYQALVRHLVGEQITYPVFFTLINQQIQNFTDDNPSLLEGLALLQTPAAQQMLIYQLDGTGTNISISNNALRSSFATEYKNMGYPQQDNIRNIAIANGSECGTSLGFAPYDTLFDMNDTTDFGYLWHNVFLEVFYSLTGNPQQFTTPLLTNTDVKVEFNLKALPDRQTQQIYKGKIYIKKTILWVIHVEEQLIGQKTLQSANTMLAIDNTGGGIYDLESLNYNLPPDYEDNVLETQFNFVPTYSSLDIGSGNQPILYTDLSRTYSPLSPPLSPKNSPFANFFTNPLASEKHIQFTLNNGNWLLKELQGNPVLYSCVSSCEAASLPLKINGVSQICNNSTQTFTISNLNSNYNGTITWSVNPSGAVSNIIQNGTSVTITSSGNLNGNATLQASLTTDCESKTINKTIYIGARRPRLLDENGEEVFGVQGYTSIYYNVNFEVPTGALEWEWRQISGNYNLLNVANNHATIYSSQPASGIFDVRTRDACGWSPRTMITVNITNNNNLMTTQENYVAFPNPATNVLNIQEASNYENENSNLQSEDLNSLSENNSSSSTLYDFSGNPVKNISPANGQMDLQGLPAGQYILVIIYGSNTESHQIVIQ